MRKQLAKSNMQVETGPDTCSVPLCVKTDFLPFEHDNNRKSNILINSTESHRHTSTVENNMYQFSSFFLMFFFMFFTCTVTHYDLI